MRTRLFVAAALVIVAAVWTATRPELDVAEAAQAQAAQGAPQPQQPRTQEMLKMHEQTITEMNASDTKLDALVKDMNAATGEAKIAAVAAVVNELVRQHQTMHGRMGQMHHQMMMMMGSRGRMMRQ